MPENHLQRREPDDCRDPMLAAHEFTSGMTPGSAPPPSPPTAPASPEFARAMREAIETKKGPLAPDWQKCLKMIKGIAEDWQDPPKYSREDAEADGLVGAVKAVNHYEPARGTPFASYARFRVRSEIQKGKMRAYGLPPNVRKDLATFRKEEEALWQSNGLRPTLAEVVAHSGLKEERILAIQRALALTKAGSLELPDEDGAIEILDEVERGDPIAGGSGGTDPLEEVLEAERHEALQSALRHAFAPWKNWYDIFMLVRVPRLTLLPEQRLTQAEVAAQLGLCREIVNRYSRAIDKQDAQHELNTDGEHSTGNDRCWKCRLAQRL